MPKIKRHYQTVSAVSLGNYMEDDSDRTVKSVAAELGITIGTVRKYLGDGKMPKHVDLAVRHLAGASPVDPDGITHHLLTIAKGKAHVTDITHLDEMTVGGKRYKLIPTA